MLTSPIALHKRYGELHEPPQGKTGNSQNAVQAERTVGTMLAVVEEGALVQAPDGAELVAAASAGAVDDDDLRQVVD